MDTFCTFHLKRVFLLLLVSLMWTGQLYSQDTSYLLWTGGGAANHPPQITSQPPPLTNKTYHYDVDATDPDGDLLRFSLTGAPDNMTIDPITGRLLWRIATGQIGLSISVTVIVNDSRGGMASQALSLTVTDEVLTTMTVRLLEGVNLQDGAAERDATVLALGVETDLSAVTDIVLPNVPNLLAFGPAVTFHLEYQGASPVIAPESTVAQLAVEDTASGGSAYEEIQAADVAGLSWQTPAKLSASETQTIVFQRTDGQYVKIGHLTLDTSTGAVTFSYDEITP